MENTTVVGVVSIAAAAGCMGIGALGPAVGEGIAVAHALTAIAQQPDESATISRTLFIGLAMIESIAIYCFVISVILIYANPFWSHMIAGGGK
jgi:F-type H+-transporting ATPase subunit c